MPIPRHFKKIEGAGLPPPGPKHPDDPGASVLGGRYQIEAKLGSGNFGTAYLVIDLRESERKVLKKISVGDIDPDETIEAVREATLLSQLDHPAIVKFHDSFLEGDFFCIVTEYCEGGDLDQVIKQLKEAGKNLEESLILDWFVQLANGVRYIHDRRILHRDLKTRNIFLKDNKIKVGDFGISRILYGTTDVATTFTGTPYYMSPEVLKHDGYNAKSDIWSLGAVLYELCTLEHAFQGQNLMSVMYKIVEGHPPQLPLRFDPQLRALFDRMMDKDQKRRPTAVEVLQDHFIKRHMEELSLKLSLKLSSSKTDASHEANAIAKALVSPIKKKQLQDSDDTDGDRALTPRQRMQRRKEQKAQQEAEMMKQAAHKNYIENQVRSYERKSAKQRTKMVPPWVGEHPDVFNDPSFSITPNLSKVEELSSDSLDMEVSGGGLGPGAAAAFHQASPLVRHPMAHMMGIDISEIPLPALKNSTPSSSEAVVPSTNIATTKNRGLEEQVPQYADDFEMASDSDEEYQAIYDQLVEAMELPAKEKVAPVAPSYDDLSAARDKRIALLKEQGQRLLGVEVFQQVHAYLRAARQDSGMINEGEVMAGLKSITSNTRDCFIVDQLVFLEKQAENSL